MLTTVLLFLIILGILVFVHEAGHFYAARKMGMKVEEFGFGFPPRIWGKTGKDGVIYSINWIPLGGFCKIKGEDGDSLDFDSFGAKKACGFSIRRLGRPVPPVIVSANW